MPTSTSAQDCSLRNLVGHHLCCEPIFHCKVGHEVQSCTRDGEKDSCVSCLPGWMQLNEVSSFDQDNRCFKPQENKCPPRAVNSAEEYDFLGCPGMKCKCDIDNCSYGKDPCLCQRADSKCSAEKQLNIATGECEPCPKMTSKPRAGCGPCIYSEVLWRKQLKTRTSTPLYGNSSDSTPQVPGEAIKIPEPDDNILKIVLPILLSLLVVGMVISIAWFLCRRYRRHLRNHRPEAVPGVHFENPYESLPSMSRPIAPNHHATAAPSGDYDSHHSNSVICNGHLASSLQNGTCPPLDDDYVRVTAGCIDSGPNSNTSSERVNRGDLRVVLPMRSISKESTDSGKPTLKVPPTPQSNPDDYNPEPQWPSAPLVQAVAPQVPAQRVQTHPIQIPCPIQPVPRLVQSDTLSSPNFEAISYQHNQPSDSESTTPKCVIGSDWCSSLTDVKVTAPRHLASDDDITQTHCKEVVESVIDCDTDETDLLKVVNVVDHDTSEDCEEELQELSQLLEEPIDTDNRSELSDTEDKKGSKR